MTDTSSKVFKVSLNGGDSTPTWRELPGQSGSLNVNGENIDDTVFNPAGFSSIQPGLINWTMSTNALYRGLAGYNATIKKSGTSTLFEDEECSLVSGNTYQIDDITKRCFDFSKAVIVYDDASPVNSDYYTIDFMHGKITFSGAGIPSSGSSITVSGYYLPLATFSSAETFSLGMTANTRNRTSFNVAQANGGFYVYGYGLRTVGLSLSGFYDTTYDIYTLLKERDFFVIEICPDGNGKSIARGVFVCASKSQDGPVGSDESESIEFSLYIANDVNGNAIIPFSWHHESDTTLPQVIRDIIYAWEEKVSLWGQYLPNGSEGNQGETIVTDCTLSSGISDMNAFNVSLQGSGELSVV